VTSDGVRKGSAAPGRSRDRRDSRFPEVPDLIAAIDEIGSPRGRKGFGTRALLGAVFTRGLYGLPSWTWTAAPIREHPALRDVLGGAPTNWACCRFATKLRKNRGVLAGCFDACAEALREVNPDLGRDVAIDASDLRAWANGMRYVSKGGKLRERFSDADASWGHRSAISTRKGGGFYGYKIGLAVCTRTGLPLAWQTRTARHHESLFAATLLDAVKARGFNAETVAMDKGYDNARIYAECEARGVEPVIPIRRAKANQPVLPVAIGGRMFPRIARGTDRFKNLYRGRAAVEREFARLKNEHGLASFRVRGADRVALHADLTILARLAQALGRARAVSLAA
jgi:hypothetical protein